MLPAVWPEPPNGEPDALDLYRRPSLEIWVVSLLLILLILLHYVRVYFPTARRVGGG